MKRKRFGKLKTYSLFLWDKNKPSLHIKINDEHAIILDNNSPYPVGTIVTMSEYCLVILNEEN